MDKDVVLTVDYAVLVMHEKRILDEGYIDALFEKAARRNVKTILWRTLGGARGLYRSRSVPTFADQSTIWSDLLEALDPLDAAVKSADKHGVRLVAWATLQDFHIERAHLKTPNTTPFFDERPHLYWSSADGKEHHKGIPCYAYEEARKYYLDHIREVLGCGVGGVYVCFRSHAGEPAEDNQFGYNEPWRRQLAQDTGRRATPEEMRANPWIAYRMQRIRGASYTTLLGELRETVGHLPVWVGVAEGPDILIAGHCEHENPARTHLRARLDVSGWCRDGLADAVIVVASRMNPCDPSVAMIYRDATARYGRKLYPWLNMVSLFADSPTTASKRTPTPDELRGIVANTLGSEMDGAVLHEAADLEFSYVRTFPDGRKHVVNEPHADRDAQWDALMG